MRSNRLWKALFALTLALAAAWWWAPTEFGHAQAWVAAQWRGWTGSEPTPVFRHTDAEGRVIYSDRAPASGATAAELPPLTVMPPVPVAPPKLPAVNPSEALQQDRARMAEEARQLKEQRMERLIQSGSTEGKTP
ncbi:hypothetical protein [Ideonella sp.]|jgi:hypothetical protein|uniref:hypothetical protein n=1 Tax=Ideonella sp. TaxID=1929293 RepID=UPI0037C0924F